MTGSRPRGLVSKSTLDDKHILFTLPCSPPDTNTQNAFGKSICHVIAIFTNLRVTSRGTETRRIHCHLYDLFSVLTNLFPESKIKETDFRASLTYITVRTHQQQASWHRLDGFSDPSCQLWTGLDFSTSSLKDLKGTPT